MLGGSIWAYLPVGPLERHFGEGNQGGFLRRGSEEPSRESCRIALAGHLGLPLLVIYIDALFRKELQALIQRMRRRPVEMAGLLVVRRLDRPKMGNLLEKTGGF